MSIRIVSHCYAAHLPHYAEFLKYQLSSLVLNPAPCPVAITVCCAGSDRATMDVLLEFQLKITPRPFELRIHTMPLPSLGRRAIGRNAVALESTEDLIWFCDVDHVFGPGCLAALWKLWAKWEGERPAMIFPRHIKIHKDHATGDAAAAAASRTTGLVAINPDEFIDKTYNRPIGGIQIVDGAFARKWGYLPDSKWQEPRTDGLPFADFKDDVAFRSQVKVHGRIEGIELPGLFRLRHSTMTYQ